MSRKTNYRPKAREKDDEIEAEGRAKSLQVDRSFWWILNVFFSFFPSWVRQKQRPQQACEAAA